MTLLLTFFLFLLPLTNTLDTLKYDTTKVVVDTTMLNDLKRYNGNVFYSWRGITKVKEVVLPKDSVYIGEYKEKYELGNSTVYINY